MPLLPLCWVPASTSLRLAWILFLPTCVPSPLLCCHIPSHCSSICMTTIVSLGFLVTPPLRLKGKRFYIFWRELSCLSCVDCRSPYSPREKESHSSTLAWRILWTEEPGGLLSMGSHRVRHDWSDLACMHALEKEMATHSSILAWRIPGTEEPGGLPSMGSYRVEHDWSDLAAATVPDPMTVYYSSNLSSVGLGAKEAAIQIAGSILAVLVTKKLLTKNTQVYKDQGVNFSQGSMCCVCVCVVAWERAVREGVSEWLGVGAGKGAFQAEGTAAVKLDALTASLPRGSSVETQSVQAPRACLPSAYFRLCHFVS